MTIFSILSLFISIISLILSICLTLRNWWIERFNLDFNLVKWYRKDSHEYFFLWLNIINNSKLPCAITEMKIEYKNNVTQFALSNGNGKFISHYQITEQTKELYSVSYPIVLESYGSVGGYFHFSSKEKSYNFEEKMIQLTIITNRGINTKNIFLDYGKNIYRVRQQNITTPVTEHPDFHTDGTPICYLNDNL